jgi:uncharacterized protein YecT (DUF1311 family)
MTQYRSILLIGISMMHLALPIKAIATEDRQCLQQAQTQQAMNSCQNLDFEQADAELNRVYRQIQQLYQDDPIFLAKLKQSQRMWIKQRDADLALRFPAEDTAFSYGSAYPVCYAAVATDLTTQRIGFLKQWISGIEEGDICSGSVKTPAQITEALKPQQ